MQRQNHREFVVGASSFNTLCWDFDGSACITPQNQFLDDREKEEGRDRRKGKEKRNSPNTEKII